MFPYYPYYWSASTSNVPSGAMLPGMLERDLGLDRLPEEVQEALEQHRDEMQTEDDISHFIDELNLRK